jgi:hypothetical protein
MSSFSLTVYSMTLSTASRGDRSRELAAVWLSGWALKHLSEMWPYDQSCFVAGSVSTELYRLWLLREVTYMMSIHSTLLFCVVSLFSNSLIYILFVCVLEIPWGSVLCQYDVICRLSWLTFSVTCWLFSDIIWLTVCHYSQYAVLFNVVIQSTVIVSHSLYKWKWK